jgi:type IV pilus assembly protein PilA
MSTQPLAGAPPEPKKNKTTMWIIIAIAGVVVVFVGIAVIGIVAAIAIPSLLRARVSANESSAIGDTRTVISAEMAFQSASGGTYGSIECLVAPTTCLSSYTGPSFLDASMTQRAKGGYRRTMRLNRDKSGFTYVAEPVGRNQTGIRAFCGDHTGMVCATRDGSTPGVTDDGCEHTSCQPL